MRSLCLVLMLVIAGCSHAIVSKHTVGEPVRCATPSHVVAPALDTTASTLAAVVAYKIYSNEATYRRESIAAVFGVIALAYFSGAVRGYYDLATCPGRKREYAEWKKREDDVAARKVADRETAWRLTQQAQAAARAGDCVTALQVEAEIVVLDAELHSTVYERDAAITRCKTQPASTAPPASGAP